MIYKHLLVLHLQHGVCNVGAAWNWLLEKANEGSVDEWPDERSNREAAARDMHRCLLG